MSAETIFVGLEIGTSKICAVVAAARNDGSLRILGVGETPSRGVRKGEIIDFETAQKCVYEAIHAAEQKSDVSIRSVYLSVTGAHIVGVNNRGVVILPNDREEIDEQDVAEVKVNAKNIPMPEGHSPLHAMNQHYYIDGKGGILEPVGMLGRKLEADFHIVHGIATRFRNSIRCVKEMEAPLEVEDVVLSGLASALAVLDQDQKQMGALVLDIGGGTTDYLVYMDGVVRHTGVLTVGGDHINNDISMGLRIPIARAEALKIAEGSAILGNALPGETISLKDDASFAGREIEREALNSIINMRVREMFELVKKRLDQEHCLDFLGAGVVLTGGSSQLQGITHLAEEVFGLPAQTIHAQMVSGVTSAFENPVYSTPIGLIKFAQAVQSDRGEETLISRTAARLSDILKRFVPKPKPIL